MLAACGAQGPGIILLVSLMAQYIHGLKTCVLPTSVWHSQMCQQVDRAEALNSTQPARKCYVNRSAVCLLWYSKN
jgi:hypothetical protein